MMEVLWDVIFPQRNCSLCHDSGFFSSRRPWCSHCEQCLEDLKKDQYICSRCGKYMENDLPMCLDCQEIEPLFNLARSVGPYEGGYRQVIKQFKFLEKKKLAYRMAQMMAEVVVSNPDYWPLDVVVPVPVSQEGMLSRGFNQSELLARKIARHIKVRIKPQALVRIKVVAPQRDLSGEERKKNLINAFAVSNDKWVKGKNVLLVDDVYTTGTTARECSRVLYEAGANRVSVIAWAGGKGF